MKQTIFTLLFFCLSSFSLQAQFQISGQVTDQTGTPMIGVAIISSDGEGTTTDIDGRFNILVKDGVTLTFSYLGYKPFVKEILLSEQQSSTIINVVMEEVSSILDMVTVSTGRYEKNILKEAVTLDVIGTEFLTRNSVTQLDQIISKVPGIQIIDDQASIRGSGFSFGAGSRVSVVLDGLPLLAPEGSTIPWNYVPIENISQIEVLKGAASVLYGTSAMNGLINIQTAYPTSKSKTTFQTYFSVYARPQKEYQVWWDEEPQPHIKGIYVSHRSRVTDKLDVVIGGNIHNEISYLQGANENRYRFNFNTRYRLTDKLSFGINGNIMDFSKGYWGFWKDGDSLALLPAAEILPDSYISTNFDPYLTYFDPFNNQHSIKTRFYSITFLRTGNDPNTTASNNHFEYQFNRKFKNELHLAAGISQQLMRVSSPIFEFDTLAMAPKTFTGSVNSIYAQLEKSLLDNRLTLTLGSRWEIYAFDKKQQVGFPVLRTAGTFAITPKDILRANAGQGYRLPSLAEQFIDYNSGFQNFPNPALQPEIGTSYELGYKRAFDKKAINGYFDAAVFFMDYNNLIQPLFGFYHKDTLISTISDINNYGFQYQNIADAKILGFELAATLNGKFGEFGYRLWTGYTYTFPVNMATDTTNLSSVGFFLKSAAKSVFGLDSSLYEGILLYRNLHNYRLDIELFYKNLTIGFAGNYQSQMINIDDLLVGEGYWGGVMEFFNGGKDLFPGLKQYRKAHTQGDFVFDVRLNYKVSDNLRLNFVVNNVFNYEYALRIGKINPPRMFTVKLEMGI